MAFVALYVPLNICMNHNYKYCTACCAKPLKVQFLWFFLHLSESFEMYVDSEQGFVLLFGNKKNPVNLIFLGLIKNVTSVAAGYNIQLLWNIWLEHQHCIWQLLWKWQNKPTDSPWESQQGNRSCESPLRSGRRKSLISFLQQERNSWSDSKALPRRVQVWQICVWAFAFRLNNSGNERLQNIAKKAVGSKEWGRKKVEERKGKGKGNF